MKSSLHTSDTDTSVVQTTMSEFLFIKKAAGRLNLYSSQIKAAQGGGYLSRFKGRGMEFDETRLYTPGDDARNIDWRVTARTGKPHTKLFREERERPVFISVDARSAMFFATRGVFKYVQASRLAVLTAWNAQTHGDRVGGQVFTENGGIELKPAHGQGAVLRLFQQLMEAKPAREAHPALGLDQALSRLCFHARPGSLVFVFSDFRGLGGEGEFSLMRLRRHCDVALVFLHDPLEGQLPERGRYRFAHAGRELTLDASKEVAAAHAERFLQRREAVVQLARRYRMRFMSCLTTDDPVVLVREQLRKSPRSR